MRQNEQEADAIELDLLLSGIERRYGYDFSHYARPSLRRRIDHAVREEGLASISALQGLVLRQPEAMARLLKILSVRTTSMFRDPEFFIALRDHVIPALRTYPFIRIWNAGCSTGEEVYSIAILLKEEGLYERSRLYATDLSEVVLERAQRGIFSLESMRDSALAYARAGGRRTFSSYYLTDGQHAIFEEPLRRNIVFSQHNLASDGAFNEFQLILCRNVMIYFDWTLRQRVYELLHSSLRRLGVLGLGRKETLQYAPIASRYDELPGNVRLYRRVR